jgi:hypothetical protein
LNSQKTEFEIYAKLGDALAATNITRIEGLIKENKAIYDDTVKVKEGIIATQTDTRAAKAMAELLAVGDTASRDKILDEAPAQV